MVNDIILSFEPCRDFFFDSGEDLVEILAKRYFGVFPGGYHEFLLV